jgi:hypothetical protein
MLDQIYKSCLLLVSAGALAVAAAPDSIGYVRSAGDFRMDGSTVRGNSTVFAGSVIETQAARSVVQLSGAQITISPESRAKIYGDHTVLMKGQGLIREAGRHFLEADSLRISATSNDAVLEVDIQSAKHVSVYARTGSAEVRNAAGLLLADVRPGLALSFDEQTGGSNAVELQGVVTVRDGKYFITDPTRNVTAELRGNDLAKLVGKTVKITGSLIPNATPAQGATEVVQVTGSNPSAPPTGGGHGSWGTIAIVGGVVIAGTLGGLAAAGSFNGPASTSGQ